MSAVKEKRQVENRDVYIFLFFVVYGLFSQHTFLTLLGGVTFVTILNQNWKPYLPPVLLFFMMYHWMQVFCSIVYADFSGQPVDVLFSSNENTFLIAITFLQLITISLLFNQFINAGHSRIVNLQMLKNATAALNTRNVIIGYFATVIVFPVLLSISRNNSSLLQIVSTFSIIKYIFLGILIFILLLKKTKNSWLIISILLLDFVLSFASFFSDFKTIIIMFIIVYFTVNPYLRKSTAYKLLPVVVALVVFFSFWSYVKGEYRSFLNQGTQKQMVNVSNTAALSYLLNRLGEFNTTSLKEGLTLFLSRAQYMERYSEVYARMPSEIPHRDGADMSQSIEFLLIPRFINEDKGVKDASQRTSYYTGKTFSTAAQGTSISMGYFCDLYIDYGLYLMTVPLIIIMSIIGFLYKKILSFTRYNILFIYSLLIGVFLTIGRFESDSIYFLGILRNNIVFLVLGFFVFFPFLHKFIFTKAK